MMKLPLSSEQAYLSFITPEYCLSSPSSNTKADPIAQVRFCILKACYE